MAQKSSKTTATKTKKTPTRSKKALPNFWQRNTRAIIFIIVFAIIGGVGILITRAASASGPFVSYVSSKKCLDNYHNIKADSNKVQLYDCNGTKAQQWTINTDNNTIVNANGYCLDVKGAGTSARTVVQLYHCNNTPAQVWIVDYKTHMVRNPKSGMYLDDRYSLTSNGNQIWIWPGNGTKAQQWDMPQANTKPAPTPTPTPTPNPTPNPTPTPTPTPPSTPTAPLGQSGNWSLAFADEFSGNSLDTSKWQMCNPSFSPQYDLNYCKTTYNDERQWFRASTNNPNVQVNNGVLQLIATKEGNQIYSGMVSTGPNVFGYKNLPNFKPFGYTYGYLETRVKLPSNGKGHSDGYWPSVWMLPTNQNQPAPNDGWPRSGEEDVFEVPGNDTTELHMTEHDGNTGGAGDSTVAYVSDLSADYHTFGFDWEPGYLKWYLDGKLMKTFTNSIGIKNYDFYPIINFSIGGQNSWGGAGGPLHGGVNSNTVFPATYSVDYLRVYKHK